LGSRVIAAATAVFRRVGYANASMDEIAGEAGVSKATLYRYYPTKQALFAAVLSELAVGKLAPPQDLGADPQATLEDLGRTLLDAALDPAYQDLLQVEHAERARFPEVETSLWERVIGRGVRLMAALFEREVACGSLRKLDPQLMAQEFVGMLLAYAMLQRFSAVSSPHTRDAVVRQAVSVLLIGVINPGHLS